MKIMVKLYILVIQDRLATSWDMINYQFYQKFKLLGYGKFNHLTTSNTSPHMWAQTPL